MNCEHGLARVAAWLAQRLPPSWCEGLGRALGALTWAAVPKHRRLMAAENARLCLGVDEREALRIVKASWARFGPMLFEVLRFPLMRGHLGDYVAVVGLEPLRAQMATGRGCVIATMHFGNWELMGGALAEAGVRLVAVAKQQTSRGFDQFINERRELLGMHVTNKNNVREMFRLLRDGWAIGLLSDQDPTRRDGIKLTWFGRDTWFVQGPAGLARHDDVPIFVAAMHRQADGRHVLTISPPIAVPRTADKARDIREAMLAVAGLQERHIRQNPDEWFWLHDRWATMKKFKT